MASPQNPDPSTAGARAQSQPRMIHTFAGNPLDRGEAIRRDESEIAALKAHPESRFLVFANLHVGITEHQTLNWQSASSLSTAELDNAVFLGTLTPSESHSTPTAHFAVNRTLDADASRADYSDSRLIAGTLSTPESGMVAQARAQLDWHQRNLFCTLCGGPMRPERGGQVRRCENCEKHIFPRTDPVAIMLIIDEPGGDRCLLGKGQGRMAKSNFYSALAGFIDQGESIEEAVRREVWEEAGLRVGDVHYHSSQPWPFPSQLMIGCHGIAATTEINFDPVEMSDVRWFSRDEVTRALSEANDSLRVPGALAIAHHLINAWIQGDVTI